MHPARVLAAAALGAALLAGCGGGGEPEPDRSTEVAPPASAEELLAAHGLDGLKPVDLVDHLDRLPPEDRPSDLLVSVRPGRLLVSSGEGGEEFPLRLPRDKFYVSLAPYVDETHECTYHSLTTCLGEMTAEEVDIKVVERGTGAVLVEQPVTTFDNGFVGLWLPRGIKGTITVTQGDRSGKVRFSTGPRAPTCLTTLQLT